MNKFTIKGTGDDARAALKANLDAQDAKFNASFDAFFKSPPLVPDARPPAKPATSNWAHGQIRNHRATR